MSRIIGDLRLPVRRIRYYPEARAEVVIAYPSRVREWVPGEKVTFWAEYSRSRRRRGSFYVARDEHDAMITSAVVVPNIREFTYVVTVSKLFGTVGMGTAEVIKFYENQFSGDRQAKVSQFGLLVLEFRIVDSRYL